MRTDPAPASAGPDRLELAIDSLGQEGDGVARRHDAPLRVRYALGGETVLAREVGRNRAVAEEILSASPHRVAPPCPLFGRCGGCVLQHLDREAGLAWKAGLVQAALRDAGFQAGIPIAASQSPPRTRRRMDLALRRGPGGVTIGLHERGAETVIAMDTCHVLHPTLFALIDAIRPTLVSLQGLRRTGSLSVNLFDSGPDLLLATDAVLVPRDRALLADFAVLHGVPRIAWQPEGLRDGADAVPEIICGVSPVLHRFAGVAVSPPPGAFLQATHEGETAIVEAALDGLPEKMPRGARVIELFAGCGTIGLAIAARAHVSAYEGHVGAVAALRSAGSGLRIEAHQRDLNRQPLSARELTGSNAIVLDPPHAGAAVQMREIAASAVPRIVYVSCNPAALAQDSRLLAASGYRLARYRVIDQFLWSARAESVCVFDKPATVRRGPMPRPPR